MDIISRLNRAVTYIENHLCEKIDMEEAAKIFCETADEFCRVFRVLTSMTVNEYIRKRRLTLAGIELQNTNSKIIDIALKYGYNSEDSFRRAFAAQHGANPSQVKNESCNVVIYPPVTFYIDIKGAEKMKFKIIETDEMNLLGVTKKFDCNANERWSQENEMWAEDKVHIPEKICDGYEGIWYGVWQNGNYSIARNVENATKENLMPITIPKGKYAVFTSEKGVYAGDAFPQMHRQIFESWLETSPYSQKGDLEIEVYHLWSDRAERRAKRYFELWIPVK